MALLLMKTKRKNRKSSKSVANIKHKRTMKLRNSKGAEYSYTAPKDITSSTVTMESGGSFREDRKWAEFMELVKPSKR